MEATRTSTSFVFPRGFAAHSERRGTTQAPPGDEKGPRRGSICSCGCPGGLLPRGERLNGSCIRSVPKLGLVPTDHPDGHAIEVINEDDPAGHVAVEGVARLDREDDAPPGQVVEETVRCLFGSDLLERPPLRDGGMRCAARTAPPSPVGLVPPLSVVMLFTSPVREQGQEPLGRDLSPRHDVGIHIQRHRRPRVTGTLASSRAGTPTGPDGDPAMSKIMRVVVGTFRVAAGARNRLVGGRAPRPVVGEHFSD